MLPQSLTYVLITQFKYFLLPILEIIKACIHQKDPIGSDTSSLKTKENGQKQYNQARNNEVLFVLTMSELYADNTY